MAKKKYICKHLLVDGGRNYVAGEKYEGKVTKELLEQVLEEEKTTETGEGKPETVAKPKVKSEKAKATETGDGKPEKQSKSKK